MRRIIRKSWSAWLTGFAKRVQEWIAGPGSKLDRICVLTLLLVTFVAPPLDAAVYKWVDENGVTQYSATPPPDRAGTTVNIPPPPSSAVTEEAVRKLEDRLEKSRERDAKNKEMAKNQAKKSAAMERQSLQKCRYAKENLHILQIQAPVFHLNDGGERVYVSDQERASRIQALQEQVTSYCK